MNSSYFYANSKLEKPSFLFQDDETVHSCPHTRGSAGIIVLPIELIAALTKAVYQKEEWLIYLHGTRKLDGFRVEVEQYSIPQNQRRSMSNVRLEMDEEAEEPTDLIGVLHSHHTLGIGAKFSGTDQAELNDRYPCSIVIAVPRANPPRESRLLGFDYCAVGKVKLPCGSLGEVEFQILPKGIRDWPIKHRVRREAKGEDLSGCVRVSATRKAGYVMADIRTECGIEKREIPDRVFGEDDGIVEDLPVVHQLSQFQYQENKGKGKALVQKYSMGARNGVLGFPDGYEDRNGNFIVPPPSVSISGDWCVECGQSTQKLSSIISQGERYCYKCYTFNHLVEERQMQIEQEGISQTLLLPGPREGEEVEVEVVDLSELPNSSERMDS